MEDESRHPDRISLGNLEISEQDERMVDQGYWTYGEARLRSAIRKFGAEAVGRAQAYSADAEIPCEVTHEKTQTEQPKPKPRKPRRWENPNPALNPREIEQSQKLTDQKVHPDAHPRAPRLPPLP